MFLTSAVISQQEKATECFIPSGIIEKSKNGLLIYEGDDNVDINTKTTAGKNTYHKMARTLFQDRRVESTTMNVLTHIKRKNVKTLAMNDSFKSYAFILPYEKPLKRPEGPHYPNAFNQIKDAMINSRKYYIKDLTRILLRAISRNDFKIDRRQ